MCGIFGIINTQPRKFDKRAFYTLGINNDSRGGDACGVFIDGKVEYGTNDAQKFFINFFDKSEVLKNTNQCRIALGHCRKASVGGVAPEKAQPCIVKDENDNIVFVVTHNGTIKNYKELAKKHIPEIDIDGLTDSQVITLIFYHKGFDVLTEYIGTGAFIIADYRGKKPKVYLFHGKSLATKYVVKTTEERPLFLISNKNYTVYSSIADYLYSLFSDDKVLMLTHNKLVSINESGSLYVVKEYDRSECVQQEYYSAVTPVTYGYGSDYDDDYYGASYRRSSKSQGGEVAKNTSTNASKKKLRMDDDFYIVDNLSSKAHGRFMVDIHGNVLSLEDLKTVEEVRTIFVYNGVLVNNKDSYDLLTQIASVWCCSASELYDIMPQLPHSLSPYPMKNYSINKNYLAYEIDPNNREELIKFNGTVQMLFSQNEYEFKEGIKEWQPKKQDIDKCFERIDDCKDLEVPAEIIIEYLNDFV